MPVSCRSEGRCNQIASCKYQISLNLMRPFPKAGPPGSDFHICDDVLGIVHSKGGFKPFRISKHPTQAGGKKKKPGETSKVMTKGQYISTTTPWGLQLHQSTDLYSQPPHSLGDL